jgi:hypothetical protein
MSVFRHPTVHLTSVVLAVLGLHLLTARNSEPFFNNDETRHTMTGVFVSDAVRDLPASLVDPKGYAIRYYCQYPAVAIVTWPPLFYLVEGLAMWALGPHFWVGRVCVAGFAALALGYVYRWARLQLTHPLALLAVALVALTPLVFVYSQRVMLEVPTLAMLLAAVTHFEKYLAVRRGRDAVLACLFAAFAALTRFDGLLVGVYFLVRLLATRNLWLLMSRQVVVAGLLAGLLTAPYYLFTWSVYGAGITTAVVNGTNPDSTGFLHPANLTFYPATLPNQAGWPLAVVAAFGLVVAGVRYRRQVGPAFALLMAVYAFFTPFAELEWRHAIYWLPAVAVLAGRAVQAAFEKLGRFAAAVVVLGLLVGGLWEVSRQEYRYVFGYEDAARWVLANRTTDRPVLFDGELSGSFVYHVRKHDPAQRVWVVRGDKLLYVMFSDPDSGYKQYARTEADVLDRLEAVDPEYVVIEDPPAAFRDEPVPGAELLRTTLKNHPDWYTPAGVIPLFTNYDRFADPGTRLAIYRKRHRNPNAAMRVEIEVIGLGRTLGAER